jgi:cytochrome c oxidase cbb3-type subunit 4
MNLQAILGSISTVLAFLVFVGIVAWAYGKRRKPDFEDAANAPFALPDDATGIDPGPARAGQRGLRT